MSDADLTVRPLDVDTWPAFEALVERHGGVFGGCWCTWFITTPDEKAREYEANRRLKRRCVEAGTNHAALVFDGDRAVGWAEYGTPAELPNIYHRKAYDATTTTPPDYRIVCLFVDKAYRRRGVAHLALRGALDLIAAAGGGVVEGYPHDVAPGTRKQNSHLYNGTRALFEAAGFAYDRPKGGANCVMVTTVPAAT